MKFEFFGYEIELRRAEEIDELEQARKVLEKHGFRAVRQTADKSKKRASAARANEAKKKATREKMEAAINMMRFDPVFDQKKITAYRLAKEAGVSQPTAKKFLAELGIPTGRNPS